MKWKGLRQGRLNADLEVDSQEKGRIRLLWVRGERVLAHGHQPGGEYPRRAPRRGVRLPSPRAFSRVGTACLDTLAAALAEDGDFTEAVDRQREAISLREDIDRRVNY